ncbi:MAG: hypothetical protein H7256_15025 [Bdellovibrio sp.]|nr:hypothetical protein [Bdellovibrio sp.]
MDSNNVSIDPIVKSKKFWLAKALIFIAATLSMLFSIFLYYTGNTQNAIYVGIWVPSILSAGSLLMVGYHE